MITEWINRRLPELIEEHGIVGAQLAVLHNGEIVDAAAGVLNAETGEKVTTGSLFQLASITKIWTATLVQELVNEGLLDLDRPVRDVLPQFRLADEGAAQVITPRQLLSHTAGFEGDLFFDTGTGDDAVEKFVERLVEAQQVTPPGALWSYCNSGFSVLGRIVEVLRGKPFNAVLRERLATPLGLTIATTIAEGSEAAAGHLAHGEVMSPVSDYGPTSDWPAGSALAMSARDLLTFVRMHLESSEFAAMRQPQVVLPDLGDRSSWGLGWMLLDRAGGVVIGHNGANKGLASYLWAVPAAGVAVALLTNGGDAQPVFDEVCQHLFSELAGVHPLEPPKPPVVAVPVNVERAVGVYRCAGYDVHVTPGDAGRVLVRYAGRTDLTAAVTKGEPREFTGLRDDVLIAVEEPHRVLALLGGDERARWLYFGQAAERIETPAEWITRRLPGLIEHHGVVGAQVAVLHDGEIFDAAAGVLNNETGERVTADSIFQVGSITKVWTATLVQELVNEGLLDLDRPVRDVLPEFRLADEEAARIITPRQLLSHTAGFEGDLWFDTGSGDDMLEKYVERLASAVQETPPGELYTYCNAGYVVLGRIVEVLRGKPYGVVLRERLVDPHGLRAATRRSEYPQHQVADGHLPRDGELRPVEHQMTESVAPAGSVLATTARDLLGFVRMHLDTSEFDAMQQPQVTPPDFGVGGEQGLGWALQDYGDGRTGIGHSGTTLGFKAYLRVVPDSGVAIAVLTNGGEPWPVVWKLYQRVLAEFAGVRLLEFPTPPAEPVPVDVEKVVGVYRCAAHDVHVRPSESGGVMVRFEARDHVFAALGMSGEHEYIGYRDDALIAVEGENGYHQVIVLCGRDEQDRVRWLHWGRAAARL
ncbi:serine hydrolase domain-containing protein [Lentzea sp. NPDC051213]|uniref:serine hydrolase domain-containing protein n=1 Tax=Lentzea sp. NPDC051213 TaxID=3364126 RepID=UPI00379BBD6A